MNVLHITTHLGGGVGKAIAGIAIQASQDGAHEHRICLLQAPEKDGHLLRCAEHDVLVDQYEHVPHWIDWADVMVVSWWGHPAMARFLTHMPKYIPCLLWAHTNGVYYPALPTSLVMAFDRLLVTSLFSLENPNWREDEIKKITERSDLVYGMGDFSPKRITPKIDYKKNEFFTVGYVGTLNYGKIHPEFVKYCLAASEQIDNIRFFLVGDPDLTLEQDFKKAGLLDRVIFTGYVSNVLEIMKEFDVFGYLLQPKHYGTTENVLLEAMACGIPVVSLKQNVEQYIVPSDAGYLVKSPAEYGFVLNQLSHNTALCEKLGRNGRLHVLETYDAKKNLQVFHKACQLAISEPVGSHDLSFMGTSPWEWFLSFLNKQDADNFRDIWNNVSSNSPQKIEKGRIALRQCASIFREERKSSLHHFASTYPQEKTLQFLSQQLKQE